MIRRAKSILMTALVLLALGGATDLRATHLDGTGHRHHHHHHQGTVHRVASIAAPIGIGAAFGPAGSIGYQGFKHRRAIKHRLVGHHRR